MRVLVTGASGFVGAHLVPLLRDVGHHVTSLSRDGDVDFRVDITDGDAVARAVHTTRPEGIIHLAAIAFVPEAERDATGARNVNVVGTRNVLDAAQRVGAKVVFVSSGAVYGNGSHAQPPFVEDAPLSPRGVYAETKAEAEEECLRRRGAQSIVRVRAFNHTGPGQPEGYVCSGFSKQLVQARLGLTAPVVAAGDLTPERDFSDVRDVVRAYVQALERGLPNSVYNVCSGVPTRISVLLDLLIEVAGVPVEVHTERDRLRNREASRLWGDNAKIRAELGWTSTVPLRTTLADLVDWWQQRLDPHSLSDLRADRERGPS